MRHLSAFILVLFLIILPSCKYFKGGLFGKKQKSLAAMLARQDSIRVADSLRNIQDQIKAMENARLDSLRKAEEQRLANEGKFKYNIIVGSFITPEYAKEYAELYKKQGYDVRIIRMPGSKFELVSAEGHDSFKTAVKRLTAFQDTVSLDSWMYVKK
jgi:hypothetical protein